MMNESKMPGMENFDDIAGKVSAINDEVAGVEKRDVVKPPKGEVSLESVLGADENTEVLYDDFSLPEGIDVDRNVLALATEQFKTLGLNQKQAQGVVDLSPKITEAVRAAQQKEWDTTTSNWAKEARNDREIGGANFKSNVIKAEKVLKQYDRDGALKEFLVATRAGNNPAMLRFLINVHDSVSESSIGRAGAVRNDKKMSDAELFYPDLAKRDALARTMQDETSL